MATLSRTKRVGLVALGLVLLTPMVASAPWCRAPAPAPPQPLLISASQEPLVAGAAKVALEVPLPIVVAGYGPSRATAAKLAGPLNARALVVQSGQVSFGVVVVDALLIPTDVADEVRAKSGLTETWVVATHSHSSFGGFDQRVMAQVAGTGRFRADARALLVNASLAALKQAQAIRRGCSVSAATTAPADLSMPRSGPASDGRLTRVSFVAADGPIGELVIASAHPTVVSREDPALNPDWPGLLAQAREASDAGVSLVVQGAGGNASAALREHETLEAFALRLAGETAAVPVRAAGDRGLVLVRVGVTLPEADASRLVPKLAVPAGNNLLCAQGDETAAVSLVRVGALNLLAVPGEPSLAAGRALETAGGADRVVSLAGGYLGYVEPAEVVQKNEGEARRQYYAPGLAAALEAGARAALEALALSVRPPVPP